MICRFCGKEYEICENLAFQHERFCGGKDRLEVKASE
jgi:hypothetical protein